MNEKGEGRGAAGAAKLGRRGFIAGGLSAAGFGALFAGNGALGTTRPTMGGDGSGAGRRLEDKPPCHGGAAAWGQAALPGGAPMLGFAAKPMERIRTAVIGLGSRGLAMLKRASALPGVEITAICDIQDAKIAKAKQILAAQKLPEPKTFKGPEAYRAVCDSDIADVIYNSTPWQLHVPVALAAMRGGRHVLTEVTAAMTVDDCWEIVETCEKTRRHCMQLENCIYGEIEMLTLNLVRQGVLGEPVHAEGAYNHDGRHMANDLFPAYQYWRYDHYRAHAGNVYPTHGLVPLCLTMDVNRGDRLDYVVSMECKNLCFEYFMQRSLRAGNPRKGQVVKNGDVNTSLIRTVGGKTIMLQHVVGAPRPYSRIQTVQGTRGIVSDYPYRIALEDRCGDFRSNSWRPPKEAEEIRRKYMHPLWKSIGGLAKKHGGHGGIDFIQDARWSYCLRLGLPLDTSVYDLATTGCLCELTERSVANRSQAVDVPDFMRGAWKTAPRTGLVDIDLSKFKV